MLSFHVKFVQTDGLADNGKTIYPPIFRYRGIKIQQFTKQQNIGLKQIESICRSEILSDSNDTVVNIEYKQRCTQHFLLLPQCFQDFFLRVVKNQDCVVKD